MKSPLRSTILTLGLLLAACAQTGAPPGTQAPLANVPAGPASPASFEVQGGKRLSADEFRRLASGNTLDRRLPNGARLLVHITADGSQRLKLQGVNGQTATDQGRLAYRGDRVCSSWQRINPGQETCFVYFQLGQDLVAIDLAGAMAPTRFNLLRGNPERV
ncbi:MAG: hypothetical protein EBT34_01740 [Acetobacteraceae bacterium]|jgi:hypothetical protein|nr:hypothetical protein [Acetobacteraceae bacterium]NBS42456.1 hypothetical protein [Acetobacteraceae bacterium]